MRIHKVPISAIRTYKTNKILHPKVQTITIMVHVRWVRLRLSPPLYILIAVQTASRGVTLTLNPKGASIKYSAQKSTRTCLHFCGYFLYCFFCSAGRSTSSCTIKCDVLSASIAITRAVCGRILWVFFGVFSKLT